MSRNNANDVYSAAAEAAFAGDVANGRNHPRMVILCGIPGCGKSTLAKRLESVGWVRVNQDESGNRNACETQTKAALLDGRDVVIDRCNFDRTQRAHWVCISRVMARKGHPTLAGNSAFSESIVKRMYSQFKAPTADEGIDFCRIVDRKANAVDVARDLGLL